MRRYPTNRNSGLPWLPHIPANWQVLPNGAIFRERNERDFANAELLSVTQDRGVIPQTAIEDRKDSSNEDKTNYKRVRHGDIAYNKMRMWQGAVGWSAHDGIVSPAYVVLRPNRLLNPRFYHYLFKTPAYVNYSYRNSYGICDDQLSLRYDEFKRMYSVYPDPEEQDAIVAFLDRELAQIDCFIAAKERLIALLKEQKAAIVNRAVTRGLDPDAPMKPSGIEWLGEIPAHWQVKKIKHIVSFRGGGTPSKANIDYWNGSIPWVSPKDMKVFHIKDTEEHITQEALADSSKVLIPKGSVLMVVRSGILQHTLPCAITKNDVAMNQDMKALIPRRSDISAQYLAYFINGKQNELLTLWRKIGATVESLEHEYIASTMISVPPPHEQQQIISFIAIEGKRIDAVVSKSKREIELIKEYRTTLISDAVTGKIDVRVAVAEEVPV